MSLRVYDRGSMSTDAMSASDICAISNVRNSQ